MTLAQVANFVSPHSGGIRTVLEHLAQGYAAAGHDVVQIVPGAAERTQQTPWGRRITLRATSVPGTGYRLMSSRAVARELDKIRADHLEVHDRSTLRGLGGWARANGATSVVVSHERLDELIKQWLPAGRSARLLADRSNTALARKFDAVVCTTAWAAAEFERLPGVQVTRVPLGVELDVFSPARANAASRARLAPEGTALLVMASRLSPEKRPGLALDTLTELGRRGVAARLVVMGDGPLRRSLRAAADGLPAQFLGFVADRDEFANLLACADVVLAPGPVETFCLAALEALASGTPVVANSASAVEEVLGGAGLAVPGTPGDFADAVETLLARSRADLAAAARSRAERYPWRATVDGFLWAHGLRAHGIAQPVSQPTSGPVAR